MGKKIQLHKFTIKFLLKLSFEFLEKLSNTSKVNIECCAELNKLWSYPFNASVLLIFQPPFLPCTPCKF